MTTKQSETPRTLTELPDQLSDLLELALDDLSGLDRRRYTPNMRYYHDPAVALTAPDSGDVQHFVAQQQSTTERWEIRGLLGQGYRKSQVCLVCLCGALMVNRDPDLDPSVRVGPVEYSQSWPDPSPDTDRLYAVDLMRAGNYWNAWNRIQRHFDRQASPEEREALREVEQLHQAADIQLNHAGWEGLDEFIMQYRPMVQALRDRGF